MTSTFYSITLLADRPNLAAKWAELHWLEWGTASGREELSWWVDDAAKAVQRTRVPVAFIALGHDGEVLGGLGLHQFDYEERRDRSPWIVGVIVRAERRSEGIGQALIACLEAWAITVGIEHLWVCTETAGRAISFYLKCGYERVEDFQPQQHEMVTILTKRLVPAHR